MKYSQKNLGFSRFFVFSERGAPISYRVGRLITETIYKTAELCYSYDRTRGMV